MFPKQLHYFIVLSQMHKDFTFSISQLIIVPCFHNSNHPNGCEVTSHCSIYLHFVIMNNTEHLSYTSHPFGYHF